MKNKVGRFLDCWLTQEAKAGPCSVCIPVLMRDDIDAYYLGLLLDSLATQKMQNFQLVLSVDLNSNKEIDILSLIPETITLDRVVVVECLESGISKNLNTAISRANREIVKIIFQDDFLLDENSLGMNVSALQRSRKKWLVSGCNHWNQEVKEFGPEMFPRVRGSIFVGRNTISSPSVVTFKRRNFVEFSEELSIMMDCEWYIRMCHNFGRPKILDKVTVVNRLHKAQAQHALKEKLSDEILMTKKMHNKNRLWRCNCKCAQKYPR